MSLLNSLCEHRLEVNPLREMGKTRVWKGADFVGNKDEASF